MYFYYLSYWCSEEHKDKHFVRHGKLLPALNWAYLLCCNLSVLSSFISAGKRLVPLKNESRQFPHSQQRVNA
jgi:hypothetical protein